MRAITYFCAYRRCRDLKSALENARDRGPVGIAVGKDHLALRWQRYERLMRKLEQKLEAMLDKGDA